MTMRRAALLVLTAAVLASLHGVWTSIAWVDNFNGLMRLTQVKHRLWPAPSDEDGNLDASQWAALPQGQASEPAVGAHGKLAAEESSIAAVGKQPTPTRRSETRITGTSSGQAINPGNSRVVGERLEPLPGHGQGVAGTRGEPIDSPGYPRQAAGQAVSRQVVDEEGQFADVESPAVNDQRAAGDSADETSLSAPLSFEEMLRNHMPVTAIQVRKAGIKDGLFVYRVVSDGVHVKREPKLWAATIRKLFKGDIIITLEPLKSRALPDWLQMRSHEYIDLGSAEPAFLPGRRTGVIDFVVKLTVPAALNVRAWESLELCPDAQGAVGGGKCRQRNEIRKELQRIIADLGLYNRGPERRIAPIGSEPQAPVAPRVQRQDASQKLMAQQVAEEFLNIVDAAFAHSFKYR